MGQTQAMTVTVDAATLDEARRLAGPRGLSALVNAAMQAEVRRRRVVAVLREWEEEAPSSQAAIDTARASLQELLGWTDEQASQHVPDRPAGRRPRPRA
jgi:post-segregation antitoxin (ccd killing protein)